MATSDAVILIDHGSPAPQAQADLEAVAQMAARQLGLAVYPAHMTLAEPTLAQALAQAAAAGARRVVVCPYFLSAGRHAGRDIPEQVRQAAVDHPGLTVTLSAPLGPDALLAELVCRRVEPLLGGGQGE